MSHPGAGRRPEPEIQDFSRRRLDSGFALRRAPDGRCYLTSVYSPHAPASRPPHRAGHCGRHEFSFEQRSPITATPWISISMPGTAKFDTVISALPG